MTTSHQLLERRPLGRTDVQVTTLGFGGATIGGIRGRIPDAQKRYEDIIARDSRAAVAANNLAWLYAQRGGNLDVALELARTAKQQLPQQAEVSDTLGWIYYKKNLVSLAVTSLEECAGKDPKNGTYAYHLGLAYAKNGDTRRARTQLERALKLNLADDLSVDARRVLSSLSAS